MEHQLPNGMSDTKTKATEFIAKAANTPHCESCGNLNPQMIEGEGYTVCCNECVCYGPGKGYVRTSSRFGTPSDFKEACCWAVADAKFALEGRQAPKDSELLMR